MSGEINVLSRTQTIVVDPTSSAVSVINAGPVGPPGPVGSNEVWIAATPPPNQETELWYDTSTSTLKVFTTPGSWVTFPYLRTAGGTLSGPINMGDQKVTNVGAPTAATDVARKQEVDAIDAVSNAKRGRVGSWVYAMYEGGAITATGLAGYANHALMARCVMDSSFDAVAAKVTTAVAASTWKVAIYRSDTNRMPSTLAWQGTIDSSTTGIKVLTFTALPPGIYWLCFFSAASISANVTQLGNSLFVTSPDWSSTAPNDIYPMTGWAHYMPTGVYPDPFPANGGIAATTFPAAMFRCAGAASRPAEEELPEINPLEKEK
jgi:hypothetical protein